MDVRPVARQLAANAKEAVTIAVQGANVKVCINLPIPPTQSVVTLDQESSSESEVDFDEEIQTIKEEVFGGYLQETTEENEDMEMN